MQKWFWGGFWCLFCWWVFSNQIIQVVLKGRSIIGNCQPDLIVSKCWFLYTQRQQETVASAEICFPKGIISVLK